MAENNQDNGGGNFIVKLWKTFWQPTARFSLGLLLVVGFVGGILFWGAYHWAMEMTNTEEFCIGCHEMRQAVYQEWRETIHYSNRSGVRAICSDCHVPKPWHLKVIRKIKATNELLHKVMGTIDTVEKFEEHRLKMAENVWASMKASDSRECRNCHSEAFFNPEDQGRQAKRKHKKGREKGQTCIDCHKGIAHKLPKGYEED